MQLLLNPANIETTNSSLRNKTLKKKVNFNNKDTSSSSNDNFLTLEKENPNPNSNQNPNPNSNQNPNPNSNIKHMQKIDNTLLESLTNEDNEDGNKELYSNYNDLYNETSINNIRNTINNSVKKTNSDYSDENEISGLKNDYKSNYNESYKLNYNDFNNNQNNIINNNNKLLDKIDYIIHLLEEQHNEKTNNITEELILYLFLGIFIIYVLDSFSRMSKYKR